MKKTVLIFAILLFPLLALGQQPLWEEATGESQMGEMDMQKEVKERARRDAQSKAVEKAVGVFIKSHTLVSNNQLAEDLIFAAVRGKIEKMSVLQEGWDERDRSIYRVKIKALVAPVFPEKGEGLSVKANLHKSALKEGEETKLSYQASEDCYVYIFSIAADGSVTLLFPNSQSKDNKVVKNMVYTFPDEKSGFSLQAQFLTGFKGNRAEEKIKIIATRKEEALIPLGFQEGAFKIYDAGSTGMINDLVKKLSRIEPTDWTDETVAYSITR
ncbi:MAG: DUF4384 domain-containing protein [Nitrospiraceae bacterium]|nr:DUF4384 domain-containing protein [Nitrospiraceae bacterium]